MRIFIAFKFSGEDPGEVTRTVTQIAQALNKQGHTCSTRVEKHDFYMKEHYSVKQIMEDNLKELDNCDQVLALVNSLEKSEGMLLEIGYCLGKNKKFSLAIKRGIKKTSITEMANPLIEFDTLDDLCEKILITKF